MATEPETTSASEAPPATEAPKPRATRSAPKRANGAASKAASPKTAADRPRARRTPAKASGVAGAAADGVKAVSNGAAGIANGASAAANGVVSAVTDAPKSIRKRADKIVETVKGSAHDAAGLAHDAAGKVHDAADAVQHAAGGALRSVKAKVKDALPERRRAARKAPAKAAPKPKTARKGASTGTVIGIAAAGIAAGVALNLGRKAAVQAPSALAGDWFEAVKGEHRAALALFDALQSTTDAQTHRRSVLLIQLKHALTKHALTEENVIYPALRESSEIGKGEADKLNHEHGYVKDYLYQLEMMPNNDPGFLAKVAEFRADLEAHIREEENDIFPSLHAKLGEAKNKVVTLAANKEGFKAA